MHIALSFILNWIIAPLLMTGLAWAFLPDRRDLREGLIFVGIARCIAMVLIWTDLAHGDGDYCAVLVAFNSILQMVLFAPFAVFYIKVVSREGDVAGLSYALVAKSVGVFLGMCTSMSERRISNTSQVSPSAPQYSHVSSYGTSSVSVATNTTSSASSAPYLSSAFSTPSSCSSARRARTLSTRSPIYCAYARR